MNISTLLTSIPRRISTTERKFIELHFKQGEEGFKYQGRPENLLDMLLHTNILETLKRKHVAEFDKNIGYTITKKSILRNLK